MIFGVFLKKNNKILLLGGSGNLGKAIIKSNLFDYLYFPSKKKLNLLDNPEIKKTLVSKKIDLVINCAAVAKVIDCEKNPKMAFKINIVGTENLVSQIKQAEKNLRKKIKLIHLSSDAVYPGKKGNYKENDKLLPYNNYGWTKLLSEMSVKTLKKYLIIRTKFFDKNKIKFKESPVDSYSSRIEIRDLVSKIKYLLDIDFNGIINIGNKRQSDFDAYKKYKKSLKPCKRKKILKNLNVTLPIDCSMNIKLLKRLEAKR